MARTSKAVLITGCSTGIGRATAERLEGPMAKLGAGPDAVARTIEKAITKRSPDRAWDALMGTTFPHPKR